MADKSYVFSIINEAKRRKYAVFYIIENGGKDSIFNLANKEHLKRYIKLDSKLEELCEHRILEKDKQEYEFIHDETTEPFINASIFELNTFLDIYKYKKYHYRMLMALAIHGGHSTKQELPELEYQYLPHFWENAKRATDTLDKLIQNKYLKTDGETISINDPKVLKLLNHPGTS